ncbi:hypothetical protein [Mycoplasma suis]|uniref:Uncharacterized protein n=1 Tax=Mycoplasma suis (strain KI_3806) TaxID=708248 RepID=F0V3B6_MYCS3|nr:hypothetical protein [Mycoplasma suis]CBZ40338.1 hypothetical protein MSUIS_02450 [Mycoplasma suis KI3806]
MNIELIKKILRRNSKKKKGEFEEREMLEKFMSLIEENLSDSKKEQKSRFFRNNKKN